MSVFQALERIYCRKLPDGIYQLEFVKADGHEAPMLLKVDGTTSYAIKYRNTSGAQQTATAAMKKLTASDGSDPDQYCLSIDEGNYKSLPDPLRPEERDNLVNLILEYGSASNTVTKDVTGITASDVTVTVTDATFSAKVGNVTKTVKFDAVVDGSDTTWKVGDDTVTLSDYGIAVTGDVNDEDTFSVTNTHADAPTIDVSTILEALPSA